MKSLKHGISFKKVAELRGKSHATILLVLMILSSLSTVYVESINLVNYSYENEITPNFGVNAQNAYSFSIILVEFLDVKHNVDRETILERLQKLASYITEASYGLYSFKFYLTNRWYELPNTIEFYDKDIWFLLRDSINASDSEVVFSEYSRVMIVHAGPNEAYTGSSKDIRSQYFNVHCGAPIKTNDGNLISSVIIVSEYDELGAIAHEFLHMLGALDLYGGEGERERFIGLWDIMATGHGLGTEIIDDKYLVVGKCPSHPSSWTKIKVGWFRDSDIAVINPGKHTIEILPLEDSSTGIHSIKIPITSTKYYLVEVREKKGYDSYLPDEGFLIYICNKEATNVYNGIVSLIDANPQSNTLNDAPFKPGQKYVDKEHNLLMEFHKANGKYTVKITYKAPDIAIEVINPKVETNITYLQVLLRNKGDIPVKQAVLYLFIDGCLYNKTIIKNILPNQNITFTYLYNNEPGIHTVLCEAKLTDDLIEYSEDNNRFLINLQLPGEKRKIFQEWKIIPLPKGYTDYSFQAGNVDEDLMDEVILHGLWDLAVLIDHDGLLMNKKRCSPILIEDFDYDCVNEILCILQEKIELYSLIGSLRWSMSNFLPTFTSKYTTAPYIYSNQYKITDINNDGIKDIVILDAYDPKTVKSIYGGSLSVYGALNIHIINGKEGALLGNFTVTTKENETFEFGYFSHLGKHYVGDYGLIEVEDINADGKHEIVVGLFSNNMTARQYDVESYIIYVYSVDGNLLWKKEFPTSVFYALTVVDNFIDDNRLEFLISTKDNLFLLNCEGEIIWSSPQSIVVFPVMPMTSKREIVISVSLIGKVSAIDPANGSPKWSFQVPGGEEINEYTIGVLPQLHRIFFSTDKAFYLLDEDGRQIGRIIFGTYSWPTLNSAENCLIIDVYKNKTLWKIDLRDGKTDVLFSTLASPSLIRPLNLDEDPESEYVVLSSIIEAYDSNGSLMWTFGLGGFRYGKAFDLDNDGYDDVVFIKADFQESLLFFRNGRAIYQLEDCIVEDLNGDGFKEVICVGDRGLEVYDISGNLVWNIPGADFRIISIGEKILAVSVGIFARHMNMPPQVRVYSDSGKLLNVIGFYWDPPYVKIVKSNTTGKQLILVIGPWGRGEYHLEVYDSEGRLVFDRLVSEEIWKGDLPRMLDLIDFNRDGKEEIVLAPYVFSLDGEFLTNEYKPAEEPSYLLIADIDSDDEDEKVESSYPFDVVRILGKDNNLKTEIKLDEYSEKRGLVITRSGPGEITLLIGTLTPRGYCMSH